MSGKRHADSGAPVRQRWSDKAFSTPLPAHASLISEAEMLERILRIRAEEGHLLCPTCGSTTTAVIERKVCPKCRRDLPVSAFQRDRNNADGRNSYCKECKRPADRRRMAELRKRRALEAAP